MACCLLFLCLCSSPGKARDQGTLWPAATASRCQIWLPSISHWLMPLHLGVGKPQTPTSKERLGW